MGNEWEDRYVANNFPNAHVIKSQWGEDSLRETLMAMLQGESARRPGIKSTKQVVPQPGLN
jgi:hypothetical protein